MPLRRLWTWATALNALGWLGLALLYVFNRRHVPGLSEAAPDPLPAALPPLTVVLTALNEAATIETALRSLLAQAYPGPLDVVVVDDRSTDATGAIIDRLAAQDARLTPVHITQLPPGWLGKTHALHVAAQRARRRDGWLLFTDADVIFAPHALARAVTYAEQAHVDHLVALPDLLLEGVGEKALVSVFTLMFALRFQTWLVRNPHARHAYAGVGAFNLVRRAAYDRIGGHARLRMEVGDDVKLGKLVKRAGLRQAVVGGERELRVRWQVGAWGVVRGLEKNAFSGFNYSLPFVVVGSLGLVYLNLTPFVGLLTPGPARRWAALGLSALAALYALQAERTGVAPAHVALHPLGLALFLVAVWRATYLALRRGGIEWRGTFYSLDELRRGLV